MKVTLLEEMSRWRRYGSIVELGPNLYLAHESWAWATMAPMDDALYSVADCSVVEGLTIQGGWYR